MARVIDLGLTVKDDMLAHKQFQQPGNAMTSQAHFIAMLDQEGRHVDADHRVNPNGAAVGCNRPPPGG